MKYALIALTLLIISPLCFSQTLKKDSTVCMELWQYRLLSVKYYESDTLIMLKNQEIMLKDSLHTIDSIKYASCEGVIVQKDVTIKRLTGIASEKPKTNKTNPILIGLALVELVIIFMIIR
jgi:hypothetical protein